MSTEHDITSLEKRYDRLEDAIEKLDAGADLLQLYTGFIYEGPALIKRINKKLIERSSGKQ